MRSCGVRKHNPDSIVSVFGMPFGRCTDCGDDVGLEEWAAISADAAKARREVRCECGGAKAGYVIGSPFHARWCPQHPDAGK